MVHFLCYFCLVLLCFHARLFVDALWSPAGKGPTSCLSCWIPSHIGIQGNEMVDKQAKTTLSLEPTSFQISFSNFKPSINKYFLEEWQTSWNNSIGNKLLDIKPTIGEYQSVVRNIRKEGVVLARLRLGHTTIYNHYTNSSPSFLLFYLTNFYFFHLYHV